MMWSRGRDPHHLTKQMNFFKAAAVSAALLTSGIAVAAPASANPLEALYQKQKAELMQNLDNLQRAEKLEEWGLACSQASSAVVLIRANFNELEADFKAERGADFDLAYNAKLLGDMQEHYCGYRL